MHVLMFLIVASGVLMCLLKVIDHFDKKENKS